MHIPCGGIGWCGPRKLEYCFGSCCAFTRDSCRGFVPPSGRFWRRPAVAYFSSLQCTCPGLHAPVGHFGDSLVPSLPRKSSLIAGCFRHVNSIQHIFCQANLVRVVEAYARNYMEPYIWWRLCSTKCSTTAPQGVPR